MTTTMQVVKGGGDKVLGIDLSKIAPDKLRSAFEEVLKRKPTKGTSQKEIARELGDHFLASKDPLMECENCGAGSPAVYDYCPFCGVADDEAKDGGGGEVDEVPAAASEQKINGAAIVVGGGQPKPGARATALARTEADLDARLVNIRSIAGRTAHETYALGLELRAIYDDELWTQRNDANGKPRYKTFQQFVDAEVHLRYRTVWSLMAMTREFTEPALAKHGTSVLRTLLAAPKEDRQRILDMVEDGAVKGKRGVEREVQEIRERKGIDVVQDEDASKGASGKGRGKGAAKASAAAKEAAKAKKAATVTVPLPAGKLTIEAFCRPVKKSDPPKRAKRFADKPYGQIELSNGVVVTVAIVASADGTLKFTLEARREE